MFVSTSHLLKDPSVARLVKIWGKRYTPELSLFLAQNDSLFYDSLVLAALPHSRALTADKLGRLAELRCQMAGIQKNSLYAFIPNVVDLSDANRLTECAERVFQKLGEVYQQQSLSLASLAQLRLTGSVEEKCVSLKSWGMPDIEDLVTALEPVLREFYQQHVFSKDWQTIGFITTLLNFSSHLIFRKLTPPEQVLLSPYFKFIEEQISLPWQRVCMAAARHDLDSPALKLVEQMLPASQDIALSVYRQLTKLNSNYASRRGKLSSPGIAHSIIRDIEMFQSYLWLCVLEESTVPIEQELIDLCVIVLPNIGVTWELVENFILLLLDEMINRVMPFQKSLLLPYTQAMQEAFFKKRKCFIENPTYIKLSSVVPWAYK